MYTYMYIKAYLAMDTRQFSNWANESQALLR